MDDFNDEDFFPFSINYDTIMDADDMMNITRDCVRAVRKQNYTTVGEFLQMVMSSDIQEAVEIASDESHEKASQFMLIAEMLARAEGLDEAMDMNTMRDRTNTMINFIVIESLGRKGLVEVHHKNMSFGEDMAKEIVVSKID